jgi:hypothetical protein
VKGKDITQFPHVVQLFRVYYAYGNRVGIALPEIGGKILYKFKQFVKVAFLFLALIIRPIRRSPRFIVHIPHKQPRFVLEGVYQRVAIAVLFLPEPPVQIHHTGIGEPFVTVRAYGSDTPGEYSDASSTTETKHKR